MRARCRLSTPPACHRGQLQLLTEQVAGDVGQKGVKAWILQYARADRIDYPDMAAAHGLGQPGHPETGVGPQRQRVAVMIVDTAQDYVHRFQPAPDRLFTILSAGNLATTQEIMNHIQRDLDYAHDTPNLANVRYLFEAAEYVAGISVQVQKEHSETLTKSGISGETTLIIGGQISGQSHGLMLIYPQGNYINASPETPYLQIGESKYGKPALDRIVNPAMSLTEGGRLCLVSLDGTTTRSNITVGPPFEVSLYEKDTLSVACRCKFEEQDPYLIQLREAWNAGVQAAFHKLPGFDWEQQPSLDLSLPAPQVVPNSKN